MGIKMEGLSRKNALDMSEVVHMYIRSMKLSQGLNMQRVFCAWDEVSGAAGHTIRKFYRAGKLYVTLDSSLARTRLASRKESLVIEINGWLKNDTLFVKDDTKVSFVEEVILK